MAMSVQHPSLRRSLCRSCDSCPSMLVVRQCVLKVVGMQRAGLYPFTVCSALVTLFRLSCSH